MSGITLAWPWLLLLLPLPWLVQRLLAPVTRASVSLDVPLPTLHQSANESSQVRRATQRTPGLLWLVWLGLLLAAARPERASDLAVVPSSGRDLMLVVDISGSMDTDDMELDKRAASRLEVVKVVVQAFLDRRAGDRVGLIVFGAAPYVYVPLTFDRTALMHMLSEVQSGMAGGRTAIGDATALAVKQLRDRPAHDRVLVLLTDGASNAGEVTPTLAADIAAQNSVRIYSIGFGADAMRVTSPFGVDMQLLNPSSDLDEPTLQQMAKRTGGRYFRARDSAGLAEVYRQIDAMEPVPQSDQRLRPVNALYVWPLGFACACALLLALSRNRPLDQRRQHA